MASEEAAKRLIEKLGEMSLSLVLAESCTGGLAASLLAEVPGASRVLWGSFVSYTPEAKAAMLGLEREGLEQYGLVSRETACGMALGALDKSGAALAGAVTGLAGPGGDGSAVPVGTVWIAVARRGTPRERACAEAGEFRFEGTRNEVRMQAARALLEALLESLQSLDRLGIESL